MDNRRKTPAPSPKTSEVSFEFTNVDERAKYDKELTWCIKKLENGILNERDKKRASDANKFLQTLKSKKSSVVRKRQIMHNLFGDYRTTIEKEEKKLESAKVTINPNTNESLQMMLKSKFLRKACTRGFEKEQQDSIEEEVAPENIANKIELPIKDENKPFKMTTGNSKFKFNFNALSEINNNFNS